MAGIRWLSSKGADITEKVDDIGIPDFYWHLVLYAGLSLLLRFALWSTRPQDPALWLASGANLDCRQMARSAPGKPAEK